LENLNPESLVTLTACKLEPSLATARVGQPLQFERLGYFCLDAKDSRPQRLVFNRSVTLRDSWAKIEKQQQAGSRRS
jgi:glutaminyl-tRNA synthetase